MNTKRLGYTGEDLARQYLMSKGYTVISANGKVAGVEIDIIAKKGNLLVFCEVKTRENDVFGRGLEAIDRNKQRRYVRAAKLYISKKPYQNFDVRFDVIEIIRENIEHIEDAFRA